MTQKHKISFIVSIHQPNVEVLDMFDNLYVLSKGGVNVYSGSPQSLLQYMTDCHIDCSEDMIPIETLLKVCANDCNHPSIIDMQRMTHKIQTNLKERVSREMVINKIRNRNCKVKFSPLSIWYLTQRTILVFYHTLTLALLFIILINGINGLVVVSFYNFTPIKYRDCQLDNSTQQCDELMTMMTTFRNVQYEIKFIFGYSLSPGAVISLWTSLVMSSHINVFPWEYHNGELLELQQWFYCRVGGRGH